MAVVLLWSIREVNNLNTKKMKFILSKEDWLSVGKGALVATVGSLLTYFTAYFAGANFGQYTPIVVAVWSVLANIGRKWITENQTK